MKVQNNDLSSEITVWRSASLMQDFLEIRKNTQSSYPLIKEDNTVSINELQEQLEIAKKNAADANARANAMETALSETIMSDRDSNASNSALASALNSLAIYRNSAAEANAALTRSEAKVKILESACAEYAFEANELKEPENQNSTQNELSLMASKLANYAHNETETQIQLAKLQRENNLLKEKAYNSDIISQNTDKIESTHLNESEKASITNNLNTEITLLREKILELKKKNEISEHSLTNIKDSYEEEKKSLTEQILSLEKNISKTHSSNSFTNGIPYKYDQNEKGMIDLEEKLLKQDIYIEELENKLSLNVESIKDNLIEVTKYKSICDELDKYKNENETYKCRISDLQNSLETLQYYKNEVDILKLKLTQLDKYKTRLEELESSAVELQNCKSKIQEHETLGNEVSDLKLRLQVSEQKNQELLESMESSELYLKKIKELTPYKLKADALDKYVLELLPYKEETENLQNRISQLADYKEKYVNIVPELKEKEAKINYNQTRISELERSLLNYNDIENEELKRYKKSSLELESVNIELEKCKNTLLDNEAQISQLKDYKNKFDELQKQYSNNSNYEQEIIILKETIEQLKPYKGKCKEFEKEIDELQLAKEENVSLLKKLDSLKETTINKNIYDATQKRLKENQKLLLEVQEENKNLLYSSQQLEDFIVSDKSKSAKIEILNAELEKVKQQFLDQEKQLENNKALILKIKNLENEIASHKLLEGELDARKEEIFQLQKYKLEAISKDNTISKLKNDQDKFSTYAKGIEDQLDQTKQELNTLKSNANNTTLSSSIMSKVHKALDILHSTTELTEIEHTKQLSEAIDSCKFYQIQLDKGQTLHNEQIDKINDIRNKRNIAASNKNKSMSTLEQLKYIRTAILEEYGFVMDIILKRENLDNRNDILPMIPEKQTHISKLIQELSENKLTLDHLQNEDIESFNHPVSNAFNNSRKIIDQWKNLRDEYYNKEDILVTQLRALDEEEQLIFKLYEKAENEIESYKTDIDIANLQLDVEEEKNSEAKILVDRNQYTLNWKTEFVNKAKKIIALTGSFQGKLQINNVNLKLNNISSTGVFADDSSYDDLVYPYKKSIYNLRLKESNFRQTGIILNDSDMSITSDSSNSFDFQLVNNKNHLFYSDVDKYNSLGINKFKNSFSFINQGNNNFSITKINNQFKHYKASASDTSNIFTNSKLNKNNTEIIWGMTYNNQLFSNERILYPDCIENKDICCFADAESVHSGLNEVSENLWDFPDQAQSISSENCHKPSLWDSFNDTHKSSAWMPLTSDINTSEINFTEEPKMNTNDPIKSTETTQSNLSSQHDLWGNTGVSTSFWSPDKTQTANIKSLPFSDWKSLQSGSVSKTAMSSHSSENSKPPDFKSLTSIINDKNEQENVKSKLPTFSTIIESSESLWDSPNLTVQVNPWNVITAFTPAEKAIKACASFWYTQNESNINDKNDDFEEPTDEKSDINIVTNQIYKESLEIEGKKIDCIKNTSENNIAEVEDYKEEVNEEVFKHDSVDIDPSLEKHLDSFFNGNDDIFEKQNCQNRIDNNLTISENLNMLDSNMTSLSTGFVKKNESITNNIYSDQSQNLWDQQVENKEAMSKNFESYNTENMFNSKIMSNSDINNSNINISDINDSITIEKDHSHINLSNINHIDNTAKKTNEINITGDEKSSLRPDTQNSNYMSFFDYTEHTDVKSLYQQDKIDEGYDQNTNNISLFDLVEPIKDEYDYKKTDIKDDSEIPKLTPDKESLYKSDFENTEQISTLNQNLQTDTNNSLDSIIEILNLTANYYKEYTILTNDQHYLVKKAIDNSNEFILQVEAIAEHTDQKMKKEMEIAELKVEEARGAFDMALLREARANSCKEEALSTLENTKKDVDQLKKLVHESINNSETGEPDNKSTERKEAIEKLDHYTALLNYEIARQNSDFADFGFDTEDEKQQLKIEVQNLKEQISSRDAVFEQLQSKLQTLSSSPCISPSYSSTPNDYPVSDQDDSNESSYSQLMNIMQYIQGNISFPPLYSHETETTNEKLLELVNINSEQQKEILYLKNLSNSKDVSEDTNLLEQLKSKDNDIKQLLATIEDLKEKNKLQISTVKDLTQDIQPSTITREQALEEQKQLYDTISELNDNLSLTERVKEQYNNEKKALEEELLLARIKLRDFEHGTQISSNNSVTIMDCDYKAKIQELTDHLETERKAHLLCQKDLEEALELAEQASVYSTNQDERLDGQHINIQFSSKSPTGDIFLQENTEEIKIKLEKQDLEIRSLETENIAYIKSLSCLAQERDQALEKLQEVQNELEELNMNRSFSFPWIR